MTIFKTLKAAAEMNRHAYGFEVDKKFYNKAKNQMLNTIQMRLSFEQQLLEVK